jgi:hypothetical protein
VIPVAVLLHPLLLGLGAAAAAVPIIIHLLNRRRVRPHAWAAMQWLLAALKKHQKRLRMENWLILALRVAALFLLGLALSRWVVSDATLAALTRPRRTVALLLDTSYSTAARDGARSVSDRVREEADRVLSGLQADDVVAVVVSNDVRPDRSGASPALLLPRAVGREGGARAKQALVAVRPTEAPAAWSDALAACSFQTLFQAGDVNRVLVWVTDLQATDWRAPERREGADDLRDELEALAREGATIEVVDVGGSGTGALPNLAVSEVAPGDASDVFAGHGFSLRVGVVNYGTAPVEGATLRVFLDDAPSPLPAVRVPPLPGADARTLAARETSVLIPVSRDLGWKTAGAHAVRVEVAPPESNPAADALGLDSRRVLALDVRARLKVLAWVEPSQEAVFDPNAFLKGLLVGEGSGDVFELDLARDEEDLRRGLGDPLAPPGLVLLGNRAPRGEPAQRELLAFVRGGGALIVFVGDAFDETGWNAAFAGPPAARLLPFRFAPAERLTRRETAWTLDFATAGSHPLSKAFTSGEASFVRTVPPRMFGRMALLPIEPPGNGGGVTPMSSPDPADDAVVLRFAGSPGSPGPVAIAEGPFGLGRAMYVGTALDDEWNPGAFALFLPVLLNDAALLMTRQAASGRNVLVGGTLAAALPRDATAPRLAIPGRGEETPTVRAAPSEEERPTIAYDRVGTSGVWRLAYERPPARGSSGAPRRVEEAFGVNPEPLEGCLLRADHAAVAARAPEGTLRVVSTHEDRAESKDERRVEGELTSWLLAIVLGILLLEPWLAMRFGRHDLQPAPPAPPTPPAPPAP